LNIEFVHLLASLGVQRNVSNVFTFLAVAGESTSREIERATDLRQAEVSIAMRTLRGENWINKRGNIAMSSILVTSERLNEMKFTDPYISVHMAFVVPDYRKKEFLKLDDVRRMSNLRIAVIDHTALVGVAHQLFPKAKIVLIDSWENFFTENNADVFLTTSEEGYVMIRQHPLFNVAIFEPKGYFPMLYAYPIAKNNSDTFIMLLNYWLKMEKDYGELDDKYNYWVLGNSPGLVEPRWSVLRNVLNWTA
jgi:ABC-type amino acid transport substrate-binding protein